jgi:hypothetical protein
MSLQHIGIGWKPTHRHGKPALPAEFIHADSRRFADESISY